PLVRAVGPDRPPAPAYVEDDRLKPAAKVEGAAAGGFIRQLWSSLFGARPAETESGTVAETAEAAPRPSRPAQTGEARTSSGRPQSQGQQGQGNRRGGRGGRTRRSGQGDGPS